MPKVISLTKMAKMYGKSEGRIEGYARNGSIPSHENSNGSIVFTDSDMFEIDRLGLLNGSALLIAGRY